MLNNAPFHHRSPFFPPGKYSFKGSRRRRCVGGRWDGKPPSCTGLNQMHGYAQDRKPTILVRSVGGRTAQTNDGLLLVTPGTIVHLECLFVRKFGTPQWDIDNFSGRTFPQASAETNFFTGP